MVFLSTLLGPELGISGFFCSSFALEPTCCWDWFSSNYVVWAPLKHDFTAWTQLHSVFGLAINFHSNEHSRALFCWGAGLGFFMLLFICLLCDCRSMMVGAECSSSFTCTQWIDGNNQLSLCFRNPLTQPLLIHRYLRFDSVPQLEIFSFTPWLGLLTLILSFIFLLSPIYLFAKHGILRQATSHSQNPFCPVGNLVKPGLYFCLILVKCVWLGSGATQCGRVFGKFDKRCSLFPFLLGLLCVPIIFCSIIKQSNRPAPETLSFIYHCLYLGAGKTHLHSGA